MKNPDFNIEDFLEENGIGYRSAGGGNELVLNSCPHCGKSDKFYISVDSGQYICFKCSEHEEHMKGGPIGLVMLLGDLSFKEAKKLVDGEEIVHISDDEVAKMLDVDAGEFVTHSNQRSRKIRKREKSAPLKIPKHFLKIDKIRNKAAWNYLAGRGIDDKTIQKLDLYVSSINTAKQAVLAILPKERNRDLLNKVLDSIYAALREQIKYNEDQIVAFLKRRGLSKISWNEFGEALIGFRFRNRVIFTVTVDGKVYGWVARDITKESSRKVLNSENPFKFFTLWNFDNVKQSNQIVICEGIVSAIKCGSTRAVATLGKLVTDEQLYLLRKSSAKEIFICLDPDAQKTAMKLKARLLPFFKNVYNVRLPTVKEYNCPSCGKLKSISFEKAFKGVSCECGHKLNAKEATQFLKKTPFKDAGDYSLREMGKFIKDARNNDGDDFLLAESIFVDE